MRKRHPEQRARHAKDCLPTNGAERRTGIKIARVGVSALIAGQLFMPAASLAAEAAGEDSATNDAAAATAPVAQAAPAAETAPAANAAPASATPAASAPATDSASADQQAASQQTQPAVPAATTNGSAGIFSAFQPGTSITINETRDEYYIRYSINSDITLVAAENEALENLNVENVKTDYAPGEAPRATATIPAADADKYEIAYECWEEMDGSDPSELTPVAFWYSDPGKYTPGMKKIDQFEESKFYMYSVELRLKDGNTLADDYNVNVNGNWVSNTFKTVEGVCAPNAANMLCEQPIVEMQAIDLIEIDGATTTFKAGDKPVFTASTPEGSNAIFQCEYWTGSDGSDVNSVEFWDQNITNHIDAFKPGVTYRYGVYLKPARGFYFAPGAKLMINGVEYSYQVSEASEIDPESGWAYTLWLNTDLTFTPEGVVPAPAPQPGEDNGTAANADEPTKPAAKEVAKPATGALAPTGDDAALMTAALGIAGATAATAVAAARRRNR